MSKNETSDNLCRGFHFITQMSYFDNICEGVSLSKFQTGSKPTSKFMQSMKPNESMGKNHG